MLLLFEMAEVELNSFVVKSSPLFSPLNVTWFVSFDLVADEFDVFLSGVLLGVVFVEGEEDDDEYDRDNESSSFFNWA